MTSHTSEKKSSYFVDDCVIRITTIGNIFEIDV